MMPPGWNDKFLLPIFLHIFVIPWIHVLGATTKDMTQIHSAAACYGNVNNYLRLDCPDDRVIKVTKVIQGAKLKSSECVTPATVATYKKKCCLPEPTDCKIEVQDTVSVTCNGHPECDVIAMWSLVSKQCDQDLYPITITYMQTQYTCVLPQDKFSVGPTLTTEDPATQDNNTSVSTDLSSRTSKPVVVISTHQEEIHDSSIEMSDAIIGAIIAGSVGMVLTLIVFIVYWRRKRRLRIIGKPQSSVWDYLLSQTFTVRGERGYDHFSSCRSSASSDGDPKSPAVFRKTLWLPNISPSVDDTQSDVFNDSDTAHNLEFHQIGTSSPYALLSLGVNNTSTHSMGRQQDA